MPRIDLPSRRAYQSRMIMPRRQHSLRRILAMLIMAYALALNGLLGAIASGAHAGEARLAAQLGVICTIHGMAGPASGAQGQTDPTPGKMACIEHCTIAAADLVPALPQAHLVLPVRLPDVSAGRPVADALAPLPFGRHPPARGPPALV